MRSTLLAFEARQDRPVPRLGQAPLGGAGGSGGDGGGAGGGDTTVPYTCTSVSFNNNLLVSPRL